MNGAFVLGVGALGLGQGTALGFLTVFVFVLFALGVPVVLLFGVWSLGFTMLNDPFPFVNIPIAAFEQLQSFPLVAIPLFIGVGSLINASGMASDIVGFSRASGGWLPGSTANTAIYTAGIFSAITGSNTATTASVGEALYGDLEAEGYDEEFAAATIAAGGTIGVIIPPSVMFILYGVTFNVSVPDLFLAGIVPGVMMVLGLSAVATYVSWRNDYGTVEQDLSAANVLKQFWHSKDAFVAVVILLGGIYAGVFTPSESAIVAIVYIVLSSLTNADADYRAIIESVFTAVRLSAMIIPILVTSIMVQQNLSYLGLQRVVGDAIVGLGNPWLVGGAMFVVLLLSGMTLASVPNMVLVAPLLAPAAFHLGLSPLMWGVVFLINDAIGFITPPYGLNLYVISSITGIDYVDVATSAVPYLLVQYSIWVVFFVFPAANVLAPT
jgi:C4-dicarboxylate transporter DctM subunit